MPRYFFDFHEGSKVSLDEDGTVLPDMQTARDEATEALLEVGKETLPTNGEERSLSVSVRDEKGERVLTITITYSEVPPDWVRRP